MDIEIEPRRVFVKLLYLIIILLVLNITVIIFRLYVDYNRIFELIYELFNFDNEKNIPTLYSIVILLFVAILLSLIGMENKKNDSSYLPWVGLAIIFLFLSIDELVEIHEHLIRPVRELLNLSGVFYYAWIVPYGILLILLIIFYLKFLINLPRTILVLFVVSGSTYVSGAIGFEMIGGRYAELYGRTNLLYSFFYTCEEFLEMLGIAIFIYTLLTYIASKFKSVTITINQLFPDGHN